VKKISIFTILAILVMSISTQSTAAENWEFVIAPYAHIIGIDGETSVGMFEGVDFEVGPDDILDNLDLAGMIQLEAHHKSGFGIITAYNFMDLSNDATSPDSHVNLKTDIYEGIFEGYGAYRIDTGGGPLDIYAGVRWWDVNLELIANGTKLAENKTDWVDPVVGVRWNPAIS
jgi:hypothetical protein